jgi:hypothetical protein
MINVEIGDIVEINYSKQRYNVVYVDLIDKTISIVRYSNDEICIVPISSILKQWKLHYTKPSKLKILKQNEDKIMTNNEEDAYTRGVEDGNNNCEDSENPYPIGSDEAMSWYDGWSSTQFDND